MTLRWCEHRYPLKLIELCQSDFRGPTKYLTTNSRLIKDWHAMPFKSIVLESVSYWERKRIIYNAVLAILVLIYWGADILSTGPRQWIGAALVLLIFGGVANVLYCIAYPVDLAFQMTPMRYRWQQNRWMLFTSGVILASIIALWIMLRPGMA